LTCSRKFYRTFYTEHQSLLCLSTQIDKHGCTHCLLLHNTALWREWNHLATSTCPPFGLRKMCAQSATSCNHHRHLQPLPCAHDTQPHTITQSHICCRTQSLPYTITALPCVHRYTRAPFPFKNGGIGDGLEAPPWVVAGYKNPPSEQCWDTTPRKPAAP